MTEIARGESNTRMPHISIPDVVPYLLAVLALLIVWEVHSIQVRAGRIKAVDIWSRSGIRLFLHMTPEDTQGCPVCREGNGMAFAPAVVAEKKFRPLAKTCTNPAGCRCLLVGLYGAWPEAERLQTLLKAKTSAGRVHLSREKLSALLDGARSRRTGVGMDQISIALLEAMRAEGPDPHQAIGQYRFVVDNAKEDRDLVFVVPAYLRATDLLEQAGSHQEALSLLEQFFKRYGPGQKVTHGPSEHQISVMSLRRTRLMAREK